MPFFFVFVGVLLIITGVKDTYVALGKEVSADFTGKQNFFTWVLALGSVGALGYVEKLRPFTNAFMVLILIAMVLSNSNRGDILTLISDGLNNPVTPARPNNTGSAAVTPASLPRLEMVKATLTPKTKADKAEKALGLVEKGLGIAAMFGL